MSRNQLKRTISSGGVSTRPAICSATGGGLTKIVKDVFINNNYDSVAERNEKSAKKRVLHTNEDIVEFDDDDDLSPKRVAAIL